MTGASPISRAPGGGPLARRRPGRPLFAALAAGLVLAAGPVRPAAAAGPDVLVLATFEQDAPGRPPAGWQARGGEIGDVYVVREEGGRRFLRAEAQGVSVQIGKERAYDVRRYPLLAWRWRVLALPAGGDERTKAAGDSAAGVYVVFGGWPVPRTIKYVWSSSLPVGTRTESPFSGRTKIVVLESGPAKLGRWVEEEVNVLEDYRRFFGEEPDQARGIGLLSDADNTGSRAAADYDRIVARAAPSAPGQARPGAP